MLIRYDDNNQPYQSPRTRRVENLCTSSLCVIATTTTSCVDRYKTKTKQEIPQNFFNSRITERYDQHQRSSQTSEKGIQELATTTHLYTAEIKFSKLARNQTTRKLAAWPVGRN